MCKVFRGLWLFVNIQSSRRTYASSSVFSLFSIYNVLAAGFLQHLVLQRIFRRMPMEEPPLQIQSQVPTSMPSIQRTHVPSLLLLMCIPCTVLCCCCCCCCCCVVWRLPIVSSQLMQFFRRLQPRKRVKPSIAILFYHRDVRLCRLLIADINVIFVL